SQESLRAMTPTARKIGLTALLALLTVGEVGLARSLASVRRRPPDIRQVGGTVLVYEIEDESKPPPGGSIATLPDALRQRLDPFRTLGVTARLVGNRRVEIAIPRSGDHDKVVRMARELGKPA